MTDMDKLRIKPLDVNSDYDLWRIRVDSVLDDKGLSDVCDLQDGASESSASAAPNDTATADRRKKAKAIIVTALGDSALRVVRGVTDNPALMLAKLEERFNSKSTAAQISKMAELVSLHYTDRKDDISTHIDRMAALIEKLKGMGLSIGDTMAIGILVASIKVVKLAPVVAAIKTIPSADMKWDTVATRLIEDWKDLPEKKEEATFLAHIKCNFCGRNGHTETSCYHKRQYLKRQDDDDDDDNDKKRPAKHKGERLA